MRVPRAHSGSSQSPRGRGSPGVHGPRTDEGDADRAPSARWTLSLSLGREGHSAQEEPAGHGARGNKPVTENGCCLTPPREVPGGVASTDTGSGPGAGAAREGSEGSAGG